MKKAATIIFLSAVIILSFSFVLLKILANSSDTNYFNTHWRYWFAHRAFLRQALNLHYDGDGRADYLGNRFQSILIEVDAMAGLNISDDILNVLAAKIHRATNKQTSFVYSNLGIPYQASVGPEQLKSITRRHRTYRLKDAAVVYLLLASRKQDEPKVLGSTFQEDGIILYGDAIEEFTENSPPTFIPYAVGTALHEFGHQLGLPHNSEPDCLMNEHAEIDHTAETNPDEVVTDFCELEKNLMTTIIY